MVMVPAWIRPHSPGLRSADLHAKRLRAQATPCCIFAESHDRPSLGESLLIRPQIYPCIFVRFRSAAGETIAGVLLKLTCSLRPCGTPNHCEQNWQLARSALPTLSSNMPLTSSTRKR